ncbi:Arginine metabolism regulation II [Fusarium albosuccineum]|uniref:Arginine metabolism regulation II n=1 Tax=Fusarium albosuccineum TaxID=1237068 RepID=A0A8H4KQ81_9HYPO|nr:Arginine metabolism regulation II [Fusarium albosuccineum]
MSQTQRGYRKVLCDRTLPACTRCVLSGRTCEGYGTRLSWPRENDARRSMIGPAPPEQSGAVVRPDLRLVNASSWDIQLHGLVAAPTGHVDVSLAAPQRLPVQTLGTPPSGPPQALQRLLNTSIPWTDLLHDSVERSLFEYFVHEASFSITTFGHDAFKIRETLIRMALVNTPSSTAILKSALALASFHRDNPTSQTTGLKISALRALAASTGGTIGPAESMCHVAAGMILCTLEFHQTSAVSSHWLWYVCGSKTIIKTARLDEMTQTIDFTALVGWVHYCDVMARFSLRHWKPNFNLFEGDPSNVTFEAFKPGVCADVQPANLVGPPHEILYVLSEVFDTVVGPSDARFETEDYREYLKVLEWRLRSIRTTEPDNQVMIGTTSPDFSTVIELFQLAALVYLRRASAGIFPVNSFHDQWVDRAFRLIAELPTCQWPFPLFVLGCEAHTDEQRLTILDCIARTEGSLRFRNLEPVKRIIQAVWVQNDLFDKGLDYVHKLGVILSSTFKAVPALI